MRKSNLGRVSRIHTEAHSVDSRQSSAVEMNLHSQVAKHSDAARRFPEIPLRVQEALWVPLIRIIAPHFRESILLFSHPTTKRDIRVSYRL